MRKAVVVAALSGALVLGIVGVEASARLSGATDFPIYKADNRIGYIPAPSQSGSFLNHNLWAFNELSMGTARPFEPSPERSDILLVGDSVVLGGNPYKQDERLGPQLERATGDVVWPISAGSWALQNQLTYLIDNPEVVRGADAIVFVLNGGDFAQPSAWRSDLTHPRAKPASAAAYLAAKYVVKPKPPPTPPSLAVPTRNWRDDFVRLAATTDAPITIILYPDRDMRDDLTPGQQLLSLGAAQIVLVENDARWAADLYRDGIHPSVDGTRVLAAIIAERL